MTKFIVRWAINTVALYVAVTFVPGIELTESWVSILWIALIFGLINALLRPLLKLLTCPLILLTLGLFTLLINTFLLWLTSIVSQSLGIGFHVDGFGPAFWGGLVISVVSVVLTFILKDELKGRRGR